MARVAGHLAGSSEIGERSLLSIELLFGRPVQFIPVTRYLYDVTQLPSFFSGCPSGDADGERFSACHRAMCSTGLKCSEELVPYSSTSDRRSVRKHPKTLARGVFFSSGIQILKQDV